ncbi:MAG: MFS transporter [Actinobacteria bacterium]|nr:MFS transporter [Actinomycetota bacterium]
MSDLSGAGDVAPIADRGASGVGPPGWVERLFITRRFFALFNVQVISALGDWVGFFAITSLAASISSQPEAAIALVTTARVAPGIFFAPFIGVMVDRFDRKRIMVVADVSRAVVFLLLPLVQTVPGLIVASFVLELFTLAWSPAKEATVPLVVPSDSLTTANSLGLVAAYATMPIAGPIQFVLKVLNDHLAEISFLGFLGLSRELGDTQTLAFYFDALSFLVSALLISRFVYRGLPSSSAAARRERALAAGVGAEAGAASTIAAAAADERSSLRRTIDEIREGLQFIYMNPVVRGVILGLATGLIGGAMLVPLGPTFAKFVIGNANTFPLFITALGLGVAVGVVSLSVLQRRLPKEQAFPILVFAGGVSMFFGVSMSTFWLAALGIFGLGACAGAVYVLGFTLLQEHTDDELRGRIFATMLTLVRACVLLALVIGPVLATVFNGFARAATGEQTGVPSIGVFGVDLAIPGVRLTLWLAALILCAAGVIAGRSMKLGLREQLRGGLRNAIGANGDERSRENHPTALPSAAAAAEVLAEGLGISAPLPPSHPGETVRGSEPSAQPPANPSADDVGGDGRSSGGAP